MSSVVFFVEPFYTGSHRSFADGFKKHIFADVQLFTLSGNHWKWRMHGGAVTLANKVNATDKVPDLIIATDMMDLALFKSLLDKSLSNVPIVLYFHENQLAYPWSPNDADKVLERDNHYKFINYSSALCADFIWFNSQYNQQSFLEALPGFLKQFPDHQNTKTVTAIAAKSRVMPLGLNLARFDRFRKQKENHVPVILWNHRWEFDKNPDLFFEVLANIKDRGVPFKLIVAGERFKKSPPCFERVSALFKEELLHFGYVNDFSEYARLLWQSDILPVTSNQDFFGISALEAMYCEVTPILPGRLAFPEHMPNHLNQLYYDTPQKLESLITALLKYPEKRIEVRKQASVYDWLNISKIYDYQIDKLINRK